MPGGAVSSATDDLGDDAVPPLPATRGDITCVRTSEDKVGIVSCPMRTIWDSILRPVLSRVRPEELLSLLFVLHISFRITFRSSDAYIFARGYRPDTDEFLERSETEFGQIPFQDKYTWCWLLQWIAWFMWGR
ncbi:hypothetical protein FCULG_00002882 [Fusarium culmorum]|uniref:Uncharacterized protein n=1 Tax=Fusarium culmorum TaxID=5516 RepID=A0A2T4H7D0_FUSCU|nr:hypothetical protein FCULG_00002882 [Fusarium culmorum]